MVGVKIRNLGFYYEPLYTSIHRVFPKNLKSKCGKIFFSNYLYKFETLPLQFVSKTQKLEMLHCGRCVCLMMIRLLITLALATLLRVQSGVSLRHFNSWTTTINSSYVLTVLLTTSQYWHYHSTIFAAPLQHWTWT